MLKVEEVAELFAMHPRTIRRYIREGKLGARKIGGEWRISEEDVEILMEKKVNPIHDKTNDDIQKYMNGHQTEMSGKHQVCSIIDSYIDAGEAAKISQRLIQLMNEDDPERGEAKFQYYYLREERKSRFVVWGNPAFVGKLLMTIGELTAES